MNQVGLIGLRYWLLLKDLADQCIFIVSKEDVPFVLLLELRRFLWIFALKWIDHFVKEYILR